MGKKSALARQIAELDERAPKEFDPEEEDAPEQSDEASDSQDSDNDQTGTEHYVEVGKSKLRKADDVALGPQYAGSKISRTALQEASDDSGLEYEDTHESINPEVFADPETVDMDVDNEDGDIDSENAFGDSDTEKFKDFTFRGSSNPRNTNGFKNRSKAVDFMTDSDDEEEEADNSEDEASRDESVGDDVANDDDSDVNIEEEDVSDSDSEEHDENDNDDSDDSGDDRAEVRKIMNEEQAVVATISQAVKADVDKGKAIKKQRQTFDSLLNVRIRLQKALVATNSMAVVEDKDGDVTEPYQAAEEAAIKLLNTLNSMRQQLEKSSGSVKVGTKRKRAIESETPSSDIWQRLQESESAIAPIRAATLEKWSSMVHGRGAMPTTRKLTTTAKATITDVLHEQLSNPERLIKRTRVPRSCAPLQAKQKLAEDANIYDDADFYQLLLKQLVDQRMMDSTSAALTVGEGGRPIAQWTAVKEAKTRKVVDTKASKGRKMRFTVHEKLQNFMAPEDRGSWEQDAVDRFFGTLLGQKMSLGEEGAESDDGEGDVDMPLADEALMLFRSNV